MTKGKMKWFSSLRKALTPQCCKRDYGKENCKPKESNCLQNSTSLRPLPPAAAVAIEKDKLMAKESEPSSRAYTAALATAIAAEAAAAAIRAAAEVIRLTTSMTKPSPTKLTEEDAAIRIQSAFRGHQARASFQASRGLNRLRRVVDGIAAKSQTSKTLSSLQTMSRVQMQLPPRYKLAEEIHIPPPPRKFEEENKKKKKKEEVGEGWSHGSQSREHAEAMQSNRKEAALKRERALAYAFSHQWRSSSKSTVPPAMSLDGSWLARLMAGKSWERQQNGRSAGGARPAAVAAAAAKGGGDSGSNSWRSLSVHSPAAAALSRTSSAASSKDSLSSRRSGSRCSPGGEVRARVRRHSVAGLPSATDRNGLGRSPADLNTNPVAAAPSKQAAKTGWPRPVATAAKEQPAARIRRLSLNK